MTAAAAKTPADTVNAVVYPWTEAWAIRAGVGR
jgi:hypothetical protein